MDSTAIPRELRELGQWVCWQNRDGKKMPYDAKTGRAASTTNPATWSTFDAALTAFTSTKINGKPRYDGIGFVFDADDGIAGIDLDDCLDTDGNLKTWATQIVGLFVDTYSEISPSGSGIKLFVRGRLPDGSKGRKWPCEGGAVECYDRGRYFTVTANCWPGASSELRDGQAGIDALLTQFDRPKPARAPQSCVNSQSPIDRLRVIERAAEYMQRVDPAVSGQGGHNATFRAACVLVCDFGLSVDEARPLLAEWNQRCVPPWSDHELEHKLESADQQEGPRGNKLLDGARHESSLPTAGVDVSSVVANVTQDTGKPGTPNTAVARPLRMRAIVRDFASIESKPVEWLWPGRIPLHMLTIVSGNPSVGKSFLMADITSRLTRGNPWPDDCGSPTPCDVLIVNLEDSREHTQRPRLEAARADLRRVHFVDGIEITSGDKTATEVCASLQEIVATLGDVCRRYPKLKLIVLDPLSAFLAGVKANEAGDVRAVFQPLVAIAEEHGVAIVLVHHQRKGTGHHSSERLAGSVQIGATARAIWEISRDGEDAERRRMLCGKMSVAREPLGLAYRIVDSNVRLSDGGDFVGRVEWLEGDVDLSADDAAALSRGESASSDHGEEHDLTAEWIRDTLTGVELPANEVIERGKNELLVSMRTLQRAFKRCGGKPRKHGNDGPWIWGLPDISGVLAATEHGQIA